MSKAKTLGTINGIIAATSYGTNPLFTLPLYSRGMEVNSVLFFRYTFAVAIYGIWLTFVKKVSLKLKRREIFPMFILAMLFSFSSLTLFDSFNYIEAGLACTILFIYPIIVTVIMSLFYNEKMTIATLISLVSTFIGIILLYGGKPNETLSLHGIGLVLTSALSYALYIVAVKNSKSIKKISPKKLSFYVMLFGLSVYIFNLTFFTNLQIPSSPFMWLCLLSIAILPTIISIETITIAIKLIGSTKTAILGALEPLTAIFFGILFFNEHLTLKICIGIMLIIGGVILVINQNNKKKKAL